MTAISRVASTITSAGARAVLAAGERAAQDAGVPLTIAVVDHAGHDVALLRMDGAPYVTVQVARDKAYSAAGFGMPTARWAEWLQGDASLAVGAPAAMERLVALGGGAPLVVDGAVIGGVGVSGATQEIDAQVADAAVAALVDRA